MEVYSQLMTERNRRIWQKGWYEGSIASKSTMKYILNNLSMLLIFLGTLFYSSGFAQTFSSSQNAGDRLKFEHITVDDGLSQNSGNVLLQDDKGFLWIGTQDGLNRYDGYTFKIYKYNPSDENSLSDNFVTSMIQDKSGAIWIGTRGGGINRFDPETEKFIRYQHDPDNENSLSHNWVSAIFEDPTEAGTLWIGTEFGLNKLKLNINSPADGIDTQTGTFTRFLNDTINLSNNEVTSIIEDHKGVLWIGTERAGLLNFDKENETFTSYVIDPENPKNLSDNFVTALFEDRKGELWVGTQSRGLIHFDKVKKEFSHIIGEPDNPNDLRHYVIRTIYESVDQEYLWIGTYRGGLYRYNRETLEYTRYRFDPNDEHGLSNDFILSMLEDKSGAFWVGTWGGGLNKYDKQRWKFSDYKIDLLSPNSSSGNQVWAIEEDSDGDLWIGTPSGLARFVSPDPSRHGTAAGVYELIRNEELTFYRHDASDPNSLSTNSVRAIHESRIMPGTIWIATDRGLNRLNKATGTFNNYLFNPAIPNSSRGNVVVNIYEDRTGALWLGTIESGLIKFDPNTEKFTHYLSDLNDPYSLSGKTIISIFEDRFGILWLGTYLTGLYRFDPRTEEATTYQQNPSDPYSLGNSLVYFVYEDPNESEGVLWIGTGGGLNKFDRNTKKFTHYTEQDGLPNNTVYAILGDDNGNLWLSTNNGISKFNPKTEQFRNYDLSDGLQSNEFNQGAFLKTNSGEMIFGGVKGFSYFHPERIIENQQTPPVVITDLKIFNESVEISPEENSILQKSITVTKQIELSYLYNFFSFEFAALDFTFPEMNQYAYKMEGFDKDWIYTDAKRRFATYTNLKPADYIFRVKASNSDGVWNDTGASIRITIIPPYWQTLWFRILSFITIVALVFTAHRFRIKNIETRNKTLRKEINERKRVEKSLRESEKKLKLSERMESLGLLAGGVAHDLNNIIGPIMVYPDLIKMDSAEGKPIDKDLDTIKFSAQRAADVIADLLALTRRGNYKMVTLDLNELVNNYLTSAECDATKRLQPEVTIDIQLSDDRLLFKGSNAHLPKVIMNLINNAFESMPEGGVLRLTTSSIEVEDGELNDNNIFKGKYNLLTIEDQGEGISEDDITKIFDPFFTTKMKSGKSGTGLGLSVVYNVLSDHGAYIDVESTLGIGTKFSIYFPETTEKIKTTQKDKRLHKGNGRILIVDDRQEQRDIATRMLTTLGYDVESVNNGQDAVKYLEKADVDLIWLDMILEDDMDGLDTYKEILKTNPDQKTIIVSGYSESDRVKEAEELGLNSFIQKPYKINEIGLTIQNVLGKNISSNISAEV